MRVYLGGRCRARGLRDRGVITVEYRLSVEALCPVDGSGDTYEIVVSSDRMIQVEAILEAMPSPHEQVFQEDLTERLANELGAVVTSVGVHSGVETKCVARPS